ncbi:MAG: hypothetical protein QOK05_1245 [Chloroflexota bacterium]|jgi:photosystem II stability/assembly factor-like uncharacterized protein|nr:hypothetical protein [Chloroflexota bacterium]
MAVLQRVVLAVASAVLLAGALPAFGADLQWAPYGTLTEGAASFSLAQDPSSPATTWAATMGAGLQRTDDGKAWKPVSVGVLPPRLWRIAIDPSKGPQGPAPMYVGSAGQGFFKSLDGGKSWKGSTQGLASTGSRNVRAIAMGVNELLIGTSDGAYRSQDGGMTWQAAGLSGFDISAVAFIRYAGPPTVLAAIDGVANPGARVMLTKDLGATWAPVKQGLTADVVVSAIAAGPVPTGANLRTVFLAGNAGVFKSDDGGQTWAQQSGLPAQGYGSLAMSSADPNILYVGSDGGGSGAGGVWRSTDRGGTWTALPTGITEKAVTAISLGRNNPATVIAASWNPDKPVAPVYALNDTQAPPSGQPEGGVCPEQSCQGGVQPEASAVPIASPSPSPSTSPCVGSPVVLATASAAASSPAPATSAPASPAASPSATAPEPCATPTKSLPGPPRGDIPLPVAIGVVAVLGVLLVGSLVFARLRR